jgi:hypothetical protein
LIDALQMELCVGERKFRVLRNEVKQGYNNTSSMQRTGGRGLVDATLGPDTERSERSDRPDSVAGLGDDGEAWKNNMNDTSKRLRDAQDQYEHTLGDSGMIHRRQDDEDPDEDVDYND